MTGPLSGNAGATFRAAAAWRRHVADCCTGQSSTDRAAEDQQSALTILQRQLLPQLRQRDPCLRRIQVRGGTSLIPILDMTLLLENGRRAIEAIPIASTMQRGILPASRRRVDSSALRGQTDCVFHNRLTDVSFYTSANVLTKHVHYTFDVFDRMIGKQIDPTGGGTYTRAIAP